MANSPTPATRCVKLKDLVIDVVQYSGEFSTLDISFPRGLRAKVIQNEGSIRIAIQKEHASDARAKV